MSGTTISSVLNILHALSIGTSPGSSVHSAKVHVRLRSTGYCTSYSVNTIAVNSWGSPICENLVLYGITTEIQIISVISVK